tara:strand:+ start:2421 stop:2693 length:273 start_codon:yes stop_codon:yes gene_type:complete
MLKNYNNLFFDLQELIKKKYYDIINKEILEDKLIFKNNYKKNYDNLINRLNLEFEDYYDFDYEFYNLNHNISFYEYYKGIGFLYLTYYDR